jgi:hypothetical protein
VRYYREVIAIADSLTTFEAACAAALDEDACLRRRRLNAYAEVLASTSWESTASAMLAQMQAAVGAPAVVGTTTRATRRRLTRRPTPTLPAKEPVLALLADPQMDPHHGSFSAADGA